MAVEVTSHEDTAEGGRTLSRSRMWLWIPALGVGAALVAAEIGRAHV